MHRIIFKDFIESIVNTGNSTLIPQLKGAQPFNVEVRKKNSVLGLWVDKRVMPLDQFFQIDIFYFVLKVLEDAPNNSLPKGNAIKCRIGQPGLSLDSIEARVAVKFFKKKEGDSTFRRISVIGNILVHSGVCEHGRGVLRLKSLHSKGLSKVQPKNISLLPLVPNIPSKFSADYNWEKDSTCPLPPFLVKNASRINSLGKQNIDLITIVYSDERFLKFPIMQEFHKVFPNLRKNSIQRSHVSELFRKKKYYLAFITAMIWGGINATQPQKKGEFETVNLYRVLTVDRVKIESIILKVKQLLVMGKIEECFNYLSGDGKISGVGYAYFTKLMYFIAYSERRITIKPLIFDKWTSLAYKALLLNSGQIQKMNSLYTQSFNKKYKSVSLKRPISKAYLSFVLDMECWASQIGVNSSKLEEYVFGISLKKCKTSLNPRIQFLEIVKGYHSKL